MTPEKKALKLFNKFMSVGIGKQPFQAKHDVIICVEEIIKVIPQHKSWSKSTLALMEAYGDNPDSFNDPKSEELTFWELVLIELKKLK